MWKIFKKTIQERHHCNLPYPELYYQREWKCWRCGQYWFKKMDKAGNQYFVKRK